MCHRQFINGQKGRHVRCDTGDCIVIVATVVNSIEWLARFPALANSRPRHIKLTLLASSTSLLCDDVMLEAESNSMDGARDTVHRALEGARREAGCHAEDSAMRGTWMMLPVQPGQQISASETLDGSATRFGIR